jgi:hypothetical protein
MYVLPSDGADRSSDINGSIRNSVTAFAGWLTGHAGGRALRFDTYHGSLDISFLRLSRTDAQLAAYGVSLLGQLQMDIQQAGFDQTNKIYAAYYDGTSTASCGAGFRPATAPNNTVALYLRGLPDSSVPCDTQPFAAAGAAPAYREFAMLHEIVHGLGMVPDCAPHQWRSGHVSDNPDDLMWAGDGNWVPDGWANVVLDYGNDDYYGHSIPGCPDLKNSSYLIQPGGSPDLTVTKVWWSPYHPSPGNGITFSATVQNRGTAATPLGTILGIAFLVDGVNRAFADRFTSSLAPGATITLQATGSNAGPATWPATGGTHTLTAWVDDAGRIPESNEANNKLVVPLAVKYQTFAYSASQRSGVAVYIHGLFHQSTAAGLSVASGRTVYLQRNLGGAWQGVLGRTIPANGRITVGFVQSRTYAYRWIVTESVASWGAASATTTR